MSRKPTISALVTAFILAVGVASAAAQTGPIAPQIAQHEQALARARSSHDYRSQSSELNALATLSWQSGQLQTGLDYCNQALVIEHAANMRIREAFTKDTIARIDTELGQYQQGLDLLTDLLNFWQSPANRQLAESLHEQRQFTMGMALTLSNLGRIYNRLGQQDKALDHLKRALPIWQEAGSNRGLATALQLIGRTYTDMGQGQQALDYFNRALPLYAADGERGAQALTLNEMGPAWADLGQKQKALESYIQALAIYHEIGAREGEAATLDNIGRLYRDLGQRQSALEYYNQALPIWRQVGNRAGEGRSLNDIGRAYADLGQPQNALDYSSQALTIFRETGNRRGQASALNNMGRAQTIAANPADALSLELQALSIWREVKDQRNEALDLTTVGLAYSQLNQPESSLASALAALYLARAAVDPQVAGSVENAMMMGFRKQQRPEEAIFFGLEAVHDYEEIRKNIVGLDKELQAGYAQSRAASYRTLAELLVESGRLGQAEQIIDHLKEQEFQDLVTAAAAAPSADTPAAIDPLKLSPAQQKAESLLPEIEEKARVLEEDTIASSQLQSKPARTPAEDTQLKSLQASIEREQSQIRSALANTIFSELDRQSASAAPDSAPSYLQSALAKLGPDVIGIRLLLGDDHAYAIVVTAAARKCVILSASSAQVRDQSLTALNAITSPAADPRPQLQQLYTTIVAPIEAELKAIEAPGKAAVPTLLWSLDDALRYLPMGALYDGHRYMVERFHNVLFTPESYAHITSAPLQGGESALVMGLSKSYGTLPALPGVIPELNSIVRDPSVPDSHGPMPGKLLADDRFTLAALKSELASGNHFSVVHIASHFVLEAGSGDEPFLLMSGDAAAAADGFAWNLSAMENSSIVFHGTRLLTLSACSTAKDYKSRNGFEMDGLGMVAQQKDAEAVLATLWDVNDLSTSRLMSDFYDRWINRPAQGKAEALRQAQLALLKRPAAAPQDKNGRGVAIDSSAAPASTLGYAHPYYWAPFVLIGNYQ